MDGASMRLEEYWGVGPKTSTQLETALGTEGAITAIDSMDIAALVEAGLPRGRATRILRHSHGEHGMAMLATSDTRAVYKDLLERACEYAITEHARDRLRVLTPLTSTDAMEDRLDDDTLATETWTDLDNPTREAVLDAFARFEETGGGERAAVETVRKLQEVGVNTGVFDRIAAIDTDALEDATEALGSLDTGGDGTNGTIVSEGVDDELDTLREQRDAAEQLEAAGLDVIETVQSDEIRTSEEFQEAFITYVADETAIPATRVREVTRTEAASAAAIRERFFARFEIAPEPLADADGAELREVGLSRQKIDYIRNAARTFLHDDLTRESFAQMSDEAVIEEMTTIHGVGVWTAKMFLMFSLGREDVFPVEDLGIRNGMSELYGDLSREEMVEVAEQWRPYRSIAALYIWRAYEDTPTEA